MKLWKANPNGSPKLLMGVRSLVPYRPIWGNDFWGLWRDKSSLVICGFLEGGHCTKCNIWNEDEAIHGILGGYLITFVKTVTQSKCHSFGGVLVFKQLEIQLLYGFIVNLCCWCWSKGPNLTSLCGSKNMRPSTTYTSFRDFNDGDIVFMKLHDLSLVMCLCLMKGKFILGWYH